MLNYHILAHIACMLCKFSQVVHTFASSHIIHMEIEALYDMVQTHVDLSLLIFL